MATEYLRIPMTSALRPTIGRGAVVAVALAALGAALYRSPTIGALLLCGIGLGAALTWLIWCHPEIGLIGLSFSTAQLLPRELLAVPVGAGKLDAGDLSLVLLLAVLALRAYRGEPLAVRWWAVSGPALLFAGFALFSAIYALVYQDVPLNLVVGELRPALYLGGAIVASSLVVRRGQIVTLLGGLFVVADLVAGVVILQQFLGRDSRLLAAMSAGSWQVNAQVQGDSAFGATRIVPPGHVLVYLMSLLAFYLLLSPNRGLWTRLALAAQLVFLSFGLLLTYTRAQWVASGIAMALICLLMPWERKARLARYVVGLVPVVLLLAVPLAVGLVPGSVGTFVDALGQRAGSILTPQETLDSASLEWRLFETDASADAILGSPLLGVGLGNDYRPATLLQGEARGWLWKLDGDGRLTRFIHNSYLYVTVKMGLPAIAVFLWFALSFLASGARASLTSPVAAVRTLALPATAAFAGLLEWAVFESHWMQAGSMTAVGLMVGLVGAAAASAVRPGAVAASEGVEIERRETRRAPVWVAR